MGDFFFLWVSAISLLCVGQMLQRLSDLRHSDPNAEVGSGASRDWAAVIGPLTAPQHKPPNGDGARCEPAFASSVPQRAGLELIRPRSPV